MRDSERRVRTACDLDAREVRLGEYEPWKKKQAPPKKVSHTVGALWPIYLRNYQNNDGRDAGRLEIAWNHLAPLFATVAVEELSTALILEYVESRRALSIANATINRELSCLHGMLIHGTKITPAWFRWSPHSPDD